LSEEISGRLASLMFWQKRDSFKEVSGFDLFYQLTYMSCIASAGLARSRIFELGSALSRPPSAYFERVHLLAERLSYDYAEACRAVGSSVRSDTMKSLLLRFANALYAGEPEATFLAKEAEITGGMYENEYDRDLSSLTKWTDAYASVVVSAALIIIINLVSTMIYEMGTGMVVGLMVVAILTSSFGAWILSRAAPKEVTCVFSPNGPKEQRRSARLSRILPPAAAVICIPLLLLGTKLGVVLILTGVILFPLGVTCVAGDKKIAKKDEEIGNFLRSLGGMASSTGTTIGEALTRLDFDSFPALEADIERLSRRMVAAIRPGLCWHRFALETGSKLIGETTGIFNDAVNMGADPDRVGLLCSEFAAKTILLRAKRSVVTATFTWLTVTMHGAIGGLMILILEVIIKFLSLIRSALPTEEAAEATQSVAMTMPLLSFGDSEIRMLTMMTTGMVLLLAVTNAFAILSTDGGHRLKVTFYMCILLCLSGASFLMVPRLVTMIM
jgi:flagellar protein FlaJ